MLSLLNIPSSSFYRTCLWITRIYSKHILWAIKEFAITDCCGGKFGQLVVMVFMTTDNVDDKPEAGTFGSQLKPWCVLLVYFNKIAFHSIVSNVKLQRLAVCMLYLESTHCGPKSHFLLAQKRVFSSKIQKNRNYKKLNSEGTRGFTWHCCFPFRLHHAVRETPR